MSHKNGIGNIKIEDFPTKPRSKILNVRITHIYVNIIK